MVDRYERMNYFIKSMAATYKDMDINSMSPETMSDDIYYNLTRLGVKKTDKKVDLSEKGSFNLWVTDFFRRPTNVFVSASWKYFCQFIHGKEIDDSGKEQIKIYIPQDSEHIEKSAEMIFDYLEKRDVAHRSKIGKHIRFDDIVIRLEDEQDAKDLIDFATKNEYISEGLIASNPFAFDYNGIAHACDKSLSYNSCMADMLTSYIRNRKEQNALDKASLNDFVKYTKNYYYEHFIEKKNLGEVIGDMSLIKENNNSIYTNKLLVNTKNILDLYLKGLNPNFNIDDFYQEYRIRCDNNKIDREAQEFQNARLKESENIYSVSEIDNFLFEAVRISVDKEKEDKEINNQRDSYYEKIALNRINSYLATNEPKYLTRSENLREDAENFGFREKMIHTLEQNRQNLYDYYDHMKEVRSKADFNNAIIQTYEKYQDRYEQGFSDFDGTEHCVRAIINYLYYNTSIGFTRENNARYNLERYSSKEIAKDMIEKNIGHRLESTDDFAHYIQGLVNKQNEKSYTG